MADEERAALSPFLAADFEAAAYARQLAGGGTAAAIEEQQAALQAQAAQAAAQQRQAVGRQQTQVLAQVAGVQRLDAELSQVEARVSEMRGAVQGLRARIRVASAQAQGFGRQAQNLQRAQQRVRALARFMQLARRLDAQLAGDEFGLAALTLADVERVGAGLRGVGAVDAARAGVEARRQRILARAAQVVDAGMQRLSAAEVGGGAAMLGALGALEAHVRARMDAEAARAQVEVGELLAADAVQQQVRQHNARASAGDGSDMVGVGDVVWARVEQAADALAARAQRVRVLARAARSAERADAWWQRAARALAAALAAGAVGAVVAPAYPRLVRLVEPRLAAARVDAGVLRDALGAMEAAYVARAATRIDDAHARLLATPTRRLAAGAARSVRTELEAVRGDTRLTAAVAGTAAAALRRVAEALAGAPAELINAAAQLARENTDLDAGLDAARAMVRTAASVQAQALLDVHERAAADAVLGGDADAWTRALQQLQAAAEALELRSLDVDVLGAAARLLRLYVHAACAAEALTEAMRMRVVGELPQLELLCSQVAAAAGLALPAAGAAYRALRLLRPLLFEDSAELATRLDAYAELRRVDLLGHVAGRVAAACPAADAGAHALLGCTRQQWLECVAGRVGDWAAVCGAGASADVRAQWLDAPSLADACDAVARAALERLLRAGGAQLDGGLRQLGERALNLA
ncbi:hypothetical protein LPJ63_005075 [Coemansia sp. RSA 2711]|nr:hypothetical protein LPJ63_005075 [Coemansia sp. RSA 2711]